jgi:CxxC motif-containing protein (DUF1111 family)
MERAFTLTVGLSLTACGLTTTLETNEEPTSGDVRPGGEPGPGNGSGGGGEPAPLDYVPLFSGEPVTPIVEVGADGVIVTRGSGRVRGRHELEGTFSEYGARYFENRSFAFIVEDGVAAGEDWVRVTYLPEAAPSTYGAGTNFRAWKIYGNGNVFHSNRGMEQIGPRELHRVVTRNAREGREVRVGDILEFEFGIFIAGNAPQDPDPIEGRTAYYSDTFRYRVGYGGLTPDNQDPSGRPGPEHDARLAGDTTIPWLYAEPELAFMQMALNTQPDATEDFLRGRRLFHTRFDSGEHSEPGNPRFEAHAGKLGPLFNATACTDCHIRNGGGRLREGPQTDLILKLAPGGELGSQLQRQEGEVVIERFERRSVTLEDGETVELRRPVFATTVPVSGFSARMAGRIAGVGLLEAIDEAVILQAADPDDGDGVSGRARVVAGPSGQRHLGRFGWKATQVSVAHQTAGALRSDMGVESALLGGDELSSGELEQLVRYVQLLGLPGRRGGSARGEALFDEVGCADCHRPEVITGDTHPRVELRAQTIRPYSDLLLHDMGPELADTTGAPDAAEWRTPPLWGVGRSEEVTGTVHLLHDGRARSVLEAILWHGGEGLEARDRFAALSAEDRAELVQFVESL